jgi:hypothetical protein
MNIVDLGETYGMGVASEIFGPNHVINIPTRLQEVEKSLQKADLLCFGGGEDVYPGLYGHRNLNSYTSAISRRDIFESIAFDMAKAMKVPMLGICRGAQFVCVRSGGTLFQDLYKHPSGTHKIVLFEPTTEGEKELGISSTHHQAMVPWNINHKLIGYYPNENNARHIYDTAVDPERENFPLNCDPEIVFFPDTMSLGVQGHPEFFPTNSKVNIYVRHLVSKFLERQ